MEPFTPPRLVASPSRPPRRLRGGALRGATVATAIALVASIASPFHAAMASPPATPPAAPKPPTPSTPTATDPPRPTSRLEGEPLLPRVVEGTPLSTADALPPRRLAPNELRRREALTELRERLFPPPLGEAEVDGWGVATGLDPDGIQFLRDLYAQYRAALATAPLAPSDEQGLLNASFEWDDVAERFVPRWSPVTLQLLTLRAAALETQRRAEQDLARGLVTRVPADHQAVARRIAFERLGKVFAQPTDRGTVAVDLLSCVDEARLKPAELAAIAPVLDAHVKATTAALRRRADQASVLELELARLLVQLGPAWEIVMDDDDRADVQSQLDALRSAIARLDAPIREIKLLTLSTLSKQLSPPAAFAVQDVFWQRTRPELFDDEADLTELVRASLAPRGDGGPTPDEATARLNLLAATRLRLLPLGFDAAACADELDTLAPTGPVLLDRALAGGSDGASRRAASGAIAIEVKRLGLMRRRRDVCSQAAAGLQGMLVIEETPLLERLKAYERELEVRGRADAWMAQRYQERLGELRRAAARQPRVAEREGDQPATEGSDGAASGVVGGAPGGASGAADGARPPDAQPRQPSQPPPSAPPERQRP